MSPKDVFLIYEKAFRHEGDTDGALSIESIHSTSHSANRWAQALANNRHEECSESGDRKDAMRRVSWTKTQWGKLFAETITTPGAKEFAITYSVERRDLEGDELTENHYPESAVSAIEDHKEDEGAFEGWKFSWVGELDDMGARDEIRYLVFDNGGAWQAIEKCLQGNLPTYVIAGKNVPQSQQQIIDEKDLPCLNRRAFLNMAKDLGLPKPAREQRPTNALKCFERMNFTVLGRVEESAKAFSKSLAEAFGTVPQCNHTSQMDYVVRRGGDSAVDIQLFEEECRKYLRINDPTVITTRQFAEMILKRTSNSLPAENPNLTITNESIKEAKMCLDGLTFLVPTSEPPIDGLNVHSYLQSEGGKVLGNIHMMDLVDYVVTGTAGLSPEHSTMAAQYGVRVITILELQGLVARLKALKKAKDGLGLAMGYLPHLPPKTRKRKSESTSISQPSRKSAKLVA
ncbi:hypothetical protein ONS95_009061 [Cadophora gregata]|uniref:uncharacterized protein n=1 Tax=Cadophora gregata TaxID=51156 RepID=UPI0026DAB2E5|nr:uncharacterized protein ONS95_009061 [Cadophora gregata]KAK0124075.1 hypothetical protein ONS95_009061 [Cadophora gregata]